jgi:quinol-cytochrome oxidoreductase complex cytochrome b subunit
MINQPRKPIAIERFLLHIHPLVIDEQAIRFNKTFGLGGINALLFILLVFTGILLKFTYIPTPENAYDSIQFLQHNVLFGRLLRNIHHFSATFFVITSFLHLLRVLYSQSIFHERAKNWIYGLLLMFLVLCSNFTGYLLPWDQLAYWAVTIMTGMLEYIPLIGKPLANLCRGGTVVDGTTLLNFYTLHTAVLPLFFVFLMAMHFWLVRKAKGIIVHQTTEKKMVPIYPNLVLKEIMVALIVLAFIFLVSILFDAPLLDRANISISPNPSKAPWYFVGVQELLLHVHPVVAVFIVPVLILFFFFYLPFFKYDSINIGVWFNSAKGKQLTLISMLFSFIFTGVLIIASEYFLNFSTLFPQMPLFLGIGIIPLLLYSLPVYGLLYYFKKVKSANKLELTMALVTILISSYLVMIIVGVWLRGKGMNLIF